LDPNETAKNEPKLEFFQLIWGGCRISSYIQGVLLFRTRDGNNDISNQQTTLHVNVL